MEHRSALDRREIAISNEMRRKIHALAAAAIVLFLTGLLVFFLRPSPGPRVAARIVSPEGVEMYLLQQPNWTGLRDFLKDPWFTTRFVCRTRDGSWKSYYYWHEDSYWWGRGRFVLDTNACTALLYRGKDAVIRFEWDTGNFQITRPYADGTIRLPQTVDPQEVPDRWMPRNSPAPPLLPGSSGGEGDRH